MGRAYDRTFWIARVQTPKQLCGSSESETFFGAVVDPTFNAAQMGGGKSIQV